MCEESGNNDRFWFIIVAGLFVAHVLFVYESRKDDKRINELLDRIEKTKLKIEEIQNKTKEI